MPELRSGVCRRRAPPPVVETKPETKKRVGGGGVGGRSYIKTRAAKAKAAEAEAKLVEVEEEEEEVKVEVKENENERVEGEEVEEEHKMGDESGGLSANNKVTAQEDESTSLFPDQVGDHSSLHLNLKKKTSFTSIYAWFLYMIILF